ncbi:hypothetical protein [Persephonella sp.]|uniref:flagellar biosynthesis protein FlhF n=1 Tax=Persephonella sp. TaxID=2060922 RepID=UPI002629F6CE|nr:hypothetical protein [Persephonella sp.]
MKMKKYFVRNLQEGWMLIREELGENAIIVSIKESDGQFEIIAASPGKNTQKQKNHLYERFKKSFKDEKDISGYEKLIDLLTKLKSIDLPDSLLNEIQDEIFKIYIPVVEGIKKVNISSRIERTPLRKKYINILGNISSGKSTTIAKLASILNFEREKKIAVASFDFYKVGGSEGLKRFAEMMHIPFFFIKNEKELILYKNAFDEYEHIIFDTPGNIRNLPEIEKLMTFITSSPEAENILTIPLTKKETLIDKDIRYFSKFNIDHLILTKYDEIETFNPIYFILAHYDYKISYITNGLEVPQDIKTADEILSRIAEVID